MSKLETSMHKAREAAWLPDEVDNDNPESFIKPVLDCEPRAYWAFGWASAAAVLLDIAAVAVCFTPWVRNHPALGLLTAIPAVCALAKAASILLPIQFQWTFYEAWIYRRTYYKLRQRHYEVGCAKLHSHSVKDAMDGAELLLKVRGEVAMLDRRMSEANIRLRYHLRVALWTARVIVGLAFLGAVALLVVERDAFNAYAPAFMLAGAAAYALFEFWMRDRIDRIFGLLAPTDPAYVTAITPAPRLLGTIEELKRRIHRHYDRLKGARDNMDDEDAEDSP